MDVIQRCRTFAELRDIRQVKVRHTDRRAEFVFAIIPRDDGGFEQTLEDIVRYYEAENLSREPSAFGAYGFDTCLIAIGMFKCVHGVSRCGLGWTAHTLNKADSNRRNRVHFERFLSKDQSLASALLDQLSLEMGRQMCTLCQLND